jgi:hypothetical protein
MNWWEGRKFNVGRAPTDWCLILVCSRSGRKTNGSEPKWKRKIILSMIYQNNNPPQSLPMSTAKIANIFTDVGIPVAAAAAAAFFFSDDRSIQSSLYIGLAAAISTAIYFAYSATTPSVSGLTEVMKCDPAVLVASILGLVVVMDQLLLKMWGDIYIGKALAGGVSLAAAIGVRVAVVAASTTLAVYFVVPAVQKQFCSPTVAPVAPVQ